MLVKSSEIHTIDFQEEGKTKTIFEDILAKSYLALMKDIISHIKEALRDIIIRLMTTKHQEKIVH